MTEEIAGRKIKNLHNSLQLLKDIQHAPHVLNIQVPQEINSSKIDLVDFEMQVLAELLIMPGSNGDVCHVLVSPF